MTHAPATCERPVPDVKSAQAFYVERLGFQISWYNEDGDIGAVHHGDWAIFFRGGLAPIPATLWVFASDIDATYADLTARKAPITQPLQTTVYGMREFRIVDPFETTIIFHHDQ